MQNIAIVSREIYLFRITIADNIRYAKPDATMEEVIASRVASAHDFIPMPDGYETKSVPVPGRFPEARSSEFRLPAHCCSTRRFLSSEATAAMDTRPRASYPGHRQAGKGKDYVTIAHRLSTLKECNISM